MHISVLLDIYFFKRCFKLFCQIKSFNSGSNSYHPTNNWGWESQNLKAVLVFVDFSKAFDTIHRGKLAEIMVAYGIPQETVSVIMILYKNSRSMVRPPDGDADLFDIVAGVLQGDTLAPYLFILCLGYALRTSADLHTDLGFTLGKARSTWHTAKAITDVDYADDLALL